MNGKRLFIICVSITEGLETCNYKIIIYIYSCLTITPLYGLELLETTWVFISSTILELSADMYVICVCMIWQIVHWFRRHYISDMLFQVRWLWAQVSASSSMSDGETSIAARKIY